MIRLGLVLWLNLLAALSAPPERSVALQRIDITALPDIVLYLTVTDAKENSVLGLTDREVSVLLDGRPQKITSLKSAIQGGEFLAVALLFDRSGSLRNSLDQTKAAAIDFARRMSMNDQLAVISFDDRVRIDAPFSNDRGAIENAVRGIDTGRDTALYDAVLAALELFQGVSTKRQAILILSDGKDTKSRSGRDDALAAAKKNGVPIFSLGLGDSLNEDLLSKLAAETGGQFVKAARAEELMRLYQKIADRLKNQYRLAFVTEFGQDDRWHKLLVRVKDEVESTDSPLREFIASVGPGVSRDLVSGFERKAAERNYLVYGGAGAGLGLLLGCLFVVLIKVLRPDLNLGPALILIIVLLTVLFGGIVGLVVQGIGAG
jgi:VWFA-related protein